MRLLMETALALFAGLLMTRVFKYLKMNFPDVTAFLIAGVLVGPFMLGRLGIHGIGFNTMEELESVSILNNVALGFIAFDIGNEFRLAQLKKTGKTATVIGVVYILVRCIGKYTGALFSSSLMHCGDTVRRYLGITLFPQAGVALGMVVTAEALGAQMGGLVRNIVLFSVLVYELIGPQMTRMALTRAGEIRAGAGDAGNRARFKKKEKISGSRHWRRSHQR